MTHSERPLGVTVMPIENRLDILQYVALRADELGYTGSLCANHLTGSIRRDQP